jgi:hypothetical protein
LDEAPLDVVPLGPFLQRLADQLRAVVQT